MSEAQTRLSPSAASTRGRGSPRGARGSFTPRGARGATRNSNTNTFNGDPSDNGDSIEGELGALKKKYPSQLSKIKEMFPHLSSEDILMELQENNGDLHNTVVKFTEDPAAQWEVKKKGQNRPRSKQEQPAATSPQHNDPVHSSRPSRGGRPSLDGPRSGRGRSGSEGRGGRGGRARGGPPNNGFSRHQSKASGSSDAPLAWGDAWQTQTDTNNNRMDDGWGAPAEAPVSVPKPVVKPVIPAGGSWASLLQPPKPAPQKAAPPPQPAPEKAPTPPKEPEPAAEAVEEPEPTIPESPLEEEPVAVEEPEAESEPEVPETLPVEAEVPPQELTVDNVEKLEDVAPPAPTETQASTVATSVAPDSTPTTTTPQVQAATPVLHNKYPVSKGTPGRTFRRTLDQQEGVVMPGNHAEVVRTTLKFGSMGINGDLDDEDEIVPPEPVAQPPQQPSPIAQPVASLPPTAPAQLPTPQPPAAAIETIPTPRQAPGLPSQPQAAAQTSPQPPLGPQSMTHPQMHSQNAAQYNRYAEQQQQPQAKPFDSFQHMQQQSASQQQPPTQPQAQHSQTQPQNYAQYMQPQQQPSHLGIGASSAQEQQYHNYYTDRSQPPGFGLYGNSSYMQAQAHAQQDAGASQQRSSSGLGGAVESSAQAPTSAAGQVQQPNSRYGAPTGDQGSGHATPSPAPVQTSQHQQSMGQYPMQQPFHPYYNQFMHQGFYSQPSPFAKNIYGYPQYMPSQQYPDHSSSPAGLGGFASPAQGRDSMAGTADYSRMNTSAAQQSLPQHSTAGGYNVIPTFLASRGGLPQEQQPLGGSSVGQQQGGQPQNDDMKFGENKPPTGPSSTPSLQGQPGRPGSATSGGIALGAQQGGQNPATVYGSHLNPGLHGAHQGQQSGYGVAQGQSASHYSMYAGGYPSQYSQGSARHAGGNSGTGGWYGGH